jgi:hypothetical protein
MPLVLLTVPTALAVGVFSGKKLSKDADPVAVSTTAGLMAALRSGQPGETILLAPGTYSGLYIPNVHVNGTVTIESEKNAHPAVISGLNVQDSSGLTFSGLTLSTAGLHSANQVGGSSNIAFNDCLFTGQPSVAPDVNYGVDLHDNTNISVTRSTFRYLENGIYNFGNNHATLSNNTFTALYGDGIDNVQTSNLQISNNTFVGFAADGSEHPDAIQFWTNNTSSVVQNVVIGNNLLEQGTGTPFQGIFMQDNSTRPYENVMITNNVIVGGEWHGISVGADRGDGGVFGLTISKNKLYALAGSTYTPWIQVSYSPNAVLERNSAPAYKVGAYGPEAGLVQTNDTVNTILNTTGFVTPPAGVGATAKSTPTGAPASAPGAFGSRNHTGSSASLYATTR